MGLDSCFDYYSGLCCQMLEKKKKLNCQIQCLDNDVNDKILYYINENKNFDDGLYMDIYFNMLKIVISLLNKYYLKDGTLKSSIDEKCL